MPILFTCPHCDSQTLVDDIYAGQSGPCASCGKPVQVPHAAPDSYSSQAATNVPRSAASVATMVILISVGLVSAVLVVTVLVSLLMPVLSAAGESARRTQCAGRLAQIATALRAYQQVYGEFPPAYIADSRGRPMYSWRVLILPFLNEQGLYDQFKFNEPWDSQQNIGLLSLMPEAFSCPSDPDSEIMYETSYLLVTGPRTLFPGSNSTKGSQVSDDPAETILLVECHGSGIGWTSPRDLDVTRMQFQVNGGSQEIRSHHPGGALIATMDGEIHFMANTTPSSTVQAMTTIDGGESVTLPAKMPTP